MVFLIWFIGINVSLQGQTFGDTSYYLIDSLDLEQLSKDDSILLDSSLKQYHQSNIDTIKINVLGQIVENMVNPSWKKYNSLLKDKAGLYLEQNPKGSLRRFYKRKLAGTINNVGYIYMMEGQYPFALDYYNQSMQMGRELNDSGLIASAANNIGYIYNLESNIPMAYKNYKMCLDIKRKLGDKRGTAIAINNIAGLYRADSLDVALDYYRQSLEIYEEIDNKINMSTVLNNMSFVYKQLKDYKSSLEYAQRSLSISSEIGNIRGIAHSNKLIGNVYLELQNYDSAKVYLEKAFDLAEQSKNPKAIATTSRLLYELYRETGQVNKALEMHVLFKEMEDSVKSISNKKALYKVEVNMAYEKQKALDKAENEKKVAVQKEISARQKLIIVFVVFLLVLVTIFLIMIFRRLKITREQNKIIKEQKALVDEALEELNQTNEEILAQRDKIELQNETLIKKNIEITDNINYASKLQQNLLTTPKILKNHFEESFVYFNPKDQVSGDFYWVKQKDDLTYLAVADCTGHGVSGALLTVVCNRLLEDAVGQFSYKDPAQMLDYVHEQVVKRLQAEEETVDGMDISLCIIDIQKNILKFSGAHNDMLIVRNGSPERLKADKRPVGFTFRNQPYAPFTTQQMELKKGDLIYLFTDGYSDQFGGPNYQKFYSANLEKFLFDISQKPMHEQEQYLSEKMEKWIGSKEQFDDMCIVGVRM